ncbi:flavodoxin-dependent (E)-4-hydroxy-3-methylbut-2-enyl-diphosphate synthase [Pseudodesulfovibrio piezophilus]|uniref:4-hydroxy-3-methylbut-2-en-1-yl diphosphate synthase (flavodoxin) n=1 Tax=Pseudodesulfovibrio piezophilus (strain DSM 21447 / JCM 15486 / C1TLV30) TaxID=1322246 RepID=M1WS50_PSEP2|nr:flavodoxin-dependent (E)-4-hydroxy-3-methylbut-2-enyl-diphosphate synthase [Pseudodesulfovibrio piezophilus]CCH48717.1 4-hydroxy-3-methylbut-2-en-1-yl diphosphate synthase [Pseudodesulfovibrio piezophilus C1TLV30]
MKRNRTRTLNVGNVGIGGKNPVRVQSMCNTDTRDILSTMTQIRQLADAGCEIVRVAVPDDEAAAALSALCDQSPLPLIADIHFDHRLALTALDAGVDGLRINPGNIGNEHRVDAVVRAAMAHGAPIRIGVNGGSLEKDLLRQYGGPTPEAMVESGLRHISMLEKRGFHDIKISLKTSSVLNTIAAYQLMAEKVDYPLHIGITEAGTLVRGAVKSAVGLGILLYEGIGDTLRVSLTHDPVAEIGVAYEILRSLGRRERGPEIISCPTCGRTEIRLIELAEKVEEALLNVEEVFTVAVMGCVVNGPGEAREADIGIAGGRGLGIIFRKGEVVRKVKGDENLLPEFMKEIEIFLKERSS